MENNKSNLPANVNTISDRIQRYLNKLFEVRKNKQIINNLAINDYYNVLSVEAFRAIVGKDIKNEPHGTLFMCDINDLFQANKNRGKREVNVMLKSIVDSLKSTIETNGHDDYKIGKMGDELYVYIPKKKLDTTANLSEQFQSIQENELSLSVGATDDFSKGLTHAINISDIRMCKNKKEFKLAKLRDVCGDSLERIIDEIVGTQIDKMRLNLDKLKDANRADLRDTYKKAIQDIDVDALINGLNDNSHAEHNLDEQKDNYKELEDKYRNEAYIKLGPTATEKTVNDYILSQILSRHPIDGVVNSSYFQGLGYKKVQTKIRKDKDSQEGIDMLVTDLSGLKAINDTYGHEEGDLAICEFLTYFRDVLKEENIKTYSDIIVKGGGNSYVIMDSLTDAQKQQLSSRLQRYGNDKEAKPKLSVLCSIQSIDRGELKKKKFHNAINSSLSDAEAILEEQSFDKKIKDVTDMKIAIEKVYRQIMDMADIQLLCGENSELKIKVLEMIQEGFRKVIEQEKQVEVDSKINEPQVEKSNENTNATLENDTLRR